MVAKFWVIDLINLIDWLSMILFSLSLSFLIVLDKSLKKSGKQETRMRKLRKHFCIVLALHTLAFARSLFKHIYVFCLYFIYYILYLVRVIQYGQNTKLRSESWPPSSAMCAGSSILIKWQTGGGGSTCILGCSLWFLAAAQSAHFLILDFFFSYFFPFK